MTGKKVIVIGAGASGLVAAITAARNGSSVLLLEKQGAIGKKITVTGNGRCNLTNMSMGPAYFRGDDISIVSKVLSRFSVRETKEFFSELGVPLRNRNGYLYPASFQASSVLEALKIEIGRLFVDVRTGKPVTSVKRRGSVFDVSAMDESYKADAVILATGGIAACHPGEGDTGYALAEKLGHHLSPVVPALVQLKAEGNFWRIAAGVRTFASVKIIENDREVAGDTGELQLTDYGVSGIPVFQVSRFAAKALNAGKPVTVSIDFFPEMPDKEWEKYILSRTVKHGGRSAEDFLTGVFHKKLIRMLLYRAKIPRDQRIKDVPESSILDLITLCKHFKARITGTKGFYNAQVCAGGVMTSGINPDTMESLLVKGLYFAGEVMDIDGMCGGYNLQWAWSTGYIAGTHASLPRDLYKNPIHLS